MSSEPYTIHEVNVTSRPVAGVRARIARGRVGEEFKRYLDQVYAAGKQGAVALDGQNIFIYSDPTETDFTVDFCVGVTEPFAGTGNVQPRETPEGIAATTTHVGDYARLAEATDAIRRWCRANNRAPAGVSWEVYGHWDADPAKLRTDVYYLLKSK